MQRLVLGLRTPLAVATPIAVGAQHPSHPQTGGHQGPASPTRQQLDAVRVDEHDGFLHIGLDAPIANEEVVAALTDLSALGGLAARRPAPAAVAAPAGAAAAPLIEELDAESEASSEGSAANGLMAAVDGYNPFPAGAGESQPGAFDLLTDVINNMLSNAEVMRPVYDHLARDPAFLALAGDWSRAGQGLPPPARALLLEELPAEGEEGAPRPLRGPGHEDPLLHLLRSIGRGVAAAATALGESFCHLGNLLRGLSDSLAGTLSGGAGAAAAGEGGESARRRSFQAAVVKVSVAVAIMVFTRRLAVVRMAA